MKFRKKSYIQQALAEEAKGNYKQAAAFYSKAEEFEKVGEMYELLGDMSRPLPRKIRAYQQALHWYKLSEHLEPVAAKLAKTMEVEIRADAKVSPVELHRLSEVAEYYALAKQWEIPIASQTLANPSQPIGSAGRSSVTTLYSRIAEAYAPVSASASASAPCVSTS